MKGGAPMYPYPTQKLPSLALFSVLEEPIYIRGHDAHATAGAFSSFVYKTSGRITELDQPAYSFSERDSE